MIFALALLLAAVSTSTTAQDFSAEAAIVPRGGDATIKEDGKHIVVYRRQGDGSWKVFREIWNSGK